MSCLINISALNKDHKKYIENTLVVETPLNRQISIFGLTKTKISLPFYFGHVFYQSVKEHISDNVSFDICTGFMGHLRPEQVVVRNECINFLKQDGVCIMGTQPGFGKTITSIEMMCRVEEKTMILVKQAVVLEQWIKSIEQYTPHKKIQKLESCSTMDTNADVYILNPLTLKPKKNLHFDCSVVGFLIIDEMHLVMTEILMKSLFRIHPKYLLGLSATPRRPKDDPFQKTIEWFFGPNIVERKLNKSHDVVVVKTNFSPETLKYTPKGLDWNHVLNEQAADVDRNELIVKNVLKHPERVWLILVKRIAHAELLVAKFKNHNIDIETLYGSKLKFDQKCKILIGTTSKIGVGFDHKPINGLCVAADVVEYFEQFLGRCMRNEELKPLVLDFDDDMYVLHKHFLHRISQYKKHGGTICK